MKKEIHIHFEGMCSSYNPKTDLFYQILEKNYKVVVHENREEADYLIFSVFAIPYYYCSFDKIRILYCGENYMPDLNLVDYGICSYPLSLGDRNFYAPMFVDEFGHFKHLKEINRNYTIEDVKKKQYFAGFVSGHESEFNIRGDFFKKLCEYKRVESSGGYLNNMPNGEIVSWRNDSKTKFLSNCKFTLTFESTKHYGFITEKITDAFFAETIPVYYGSETVSEIFNPKAFINCNDYNSFDEVIEKIKELDNDDEKYLAMLREPILVNPNYYEETLDKYEKFVCNIFDQDIDKAYRRSRVFSAKVAENYILDHRIGLKDISSMSNGYLLRVLGSRIKRKLLGRKKKKR